MKLHLLQEHGGGDPRNLFYRYERVCISTLILIAVLTSYGLASDRDIPDEYLAYPVHINLTGLGDASGFYIHTSSFVYLVTARHVFFDIPPSATILPKPLPLRTTDVELISNPRGSNDVGFNKIGLNLSVLFKNGRIGLASKHDVLIVQLLTKIQNRTDNYGMPLEGVKPSTICKSGLLSTQTNTVKKFHDVLTGNEAFIFGYPSSIGLKTIPQIDYDQPLLKKGIIAGKNLTRETVILDCPVYPGNSGGPVLEVGRLPLMGSEFHAIGVVSEFIPFAEMWINDKFSYSNMTLSNSGYAVVEPMDAVLQLIEELERSDR